MTPNLNSNPLAALVSATSGSARSADDSLVMLAQSTPTESGAPESTGGFLELLQSLNIDLPDPKLNPEGAAENALGALALTATPGNQVLAGIPVVQASLQLDDSVDPNAMTQGGNVLPAGGSALPAIDTRLLGPAQPAPNGATVAQPATLAPEPVVLIPEARTQQAAAGQLLAQQGQNERLPAEAGVDFARVLPDKTPRPVATPLTPETLNIPESGKAPLADTVRDLLRMQKLQGSSGDSRELKLGGPIGIDSVTSLTHADGYAGDAARTAAGVAATERPATATGAPVSFSLARPAGTPGWDQALSQRVVWMAENSMGQAELRLDPPHLGSVQVRINMSDDQTQILFQAQNPAAREALETALPRLRDMFAEQGLTLGDAEVEDHGDARPDRGGDDASGDSRDLDNMSRADAEKQDGAGRAEHGGNDVPRSEAGLVSRSLIDTYA